MNLRVIIVALILSSPGWSAGAQNTGADTVAAADTTTAAVAIAGADANAVMTRLRNKFDEVGAFSAHFRQTLDADYAESSSTVEGTIVMHGEKYRIETGGQTIVTDGMTTWVYIAEDQQVIINEYVEDEGSFTPGHFLNERTERYNVSFSDVKSPESHVVLLEAKSADTYLESAVLWINRTEYTVSRIDVVDVNGASIRFEMSNIDLSPDADESTFTYEPPEGVEVVDLR